MGSFRPAEEGEVEEPRRGQAGDYGGSDRPDRGEREGGAQHRSDLAEARAEAALEQDEQQRSAANEAGELVVREVDPAESIRADGHTQPQEQHEGRQPEPGGEHRCEHPTGEQGSRDEDELRVVDHSRARCQTTRPSSPTMRA